MSSQVGSRGVRILAPAGPARARSRDGDRQLRPPFTAQIIVRSGRRHRAGPPSLTDVHHAGQTRRPPPRDIRRSTISSCQTTATRRAHLPVILCQTSSNRHHPPALDSASPWAVVEGCSARSGTSGSSRRWKWQLKKGPLWPREKGPPVGFVSTSSEAAPAPNSAFHCGCRQQRRGGGSGPPPGAEVGSSPRPVRRRGRPGRPRPGRAARPISAA